MIIDEVVFVTMNSIKPLNNEGYQKHTKVKPPGALCVEGFNVIALLGSSNLHVHDAHELHLLLMNEEHVPHDTRVVAEKCYMNSSHHRSIL